MKILVLGAGITGVTSAYALARRGHEVTVVEQDSAAAQETSFANGGQLSYSHAEPWANPHVFPKLARWAFQKDAPLVFRPSTDPHMILWGLMFLRNCAPDRTRAGSETLLRIGQYAREKMHALIAETSISFDYLSTGILHVFSHQKEFDGAAKQARYQESLGGHEEVLTADECIAKEPALSRTTRTIIGGIYAPGDESGDIHTFTEKLAAYCENRFNTRFLYNTSVLRLKQDDDRVRAVATTAGDLSADAYVMALGPWSPILLREIGISLPIYPMKGYSITVPAWEGAPTVSITDDENKVVFTRLGNHVRAAGTAEFAGYDKTIRPHRIAPIVRSLQGLFPDASTEGMTEWACLRPQTPDGPPIVGATRYRNLFLNTGHGTLGWTQCAGTASLLADVMEGKPTEISLTGLEAARYA